MSFDIWEPSNTALVVAVNGVLSFTDYLLVTLNVNDDDDQFMNCKEIREFLSTLLKKKKNNDYNNFFSKIQLF